MEKVKNKGNKADAKAPGHTVAAKKRRIEKDTAAQVAKVKLRTSVHMYIFFRF